MSKKEQSIASIELTRLKILNEQLGNTILWSRNKQLGRFFPIRANRLKSLSNNYNLFNNFTQNQYRTYQATCKLLNDFNCVNKPHDDLNLYLFKSQILERQNKIYKQLSFFRKINYFLRVFLMTKNLGLLLRDKWVQHRSKKRTKNLKTNHPDLYNYYIETSMEIRQSIARFNKKENSYETSKEEIKQLILNARMFYRDYIKESRRESAIEFSLKDCDYYVREWSPEWERKCEHYKNQLDNDVSKVINSMLQRLNRWKMELQRLDPFALSSSLNDFQALHIGRTDNLWKKRGELEEKRLMSYKFIGFQGDWRKKDWVHVRRFLSDWDAEWNQRFITLQDSLETYWINVNNHCRKIFGPSLALNESDKKLDTSPSIQKIISDFDNQRSLSEQWLEDKSCSSERDFLINLSIQLNSKDVKFCQNKLRKALRLKYHPDHHQDAIQEATIIYNEIDDVCKKSAQVLELLLNLNPDDKFDVYSGKLRDTQNDLLLQKLKRKFDRDISQVVEQVSQIDREINLLHEKIEKQNKTLEKLNKTLEKQNKTLEKQHSEMNSLKEEFNEFKRFLKENSYPNNFFKSSIDNGQGKNHPEKELTSSHINQTTSNRNIFFKSSIDNEAGKNKPKYNKERLKENKYLQETNSDQEINLPINQEYFYQDQNLDLC